MVTGATSGLGFATARALATQGATVVGVGRTAATTSAARARMSAGTAGIEWLTADFRALGQVRDLAAEFRRRHSRLDVLVNNAGGTFRTRQLTIEGIELTLAVNHLAPFLLTNLLLDILEASAPSRIVNVSSIAHLRGDLDFADLEMRRGYRPFRAYARSKLANLLFTYELARRLEGTGVTVNAVHPGLVRTRLGSRNGPVRSLGWRLLHLRHHSVSVDPERGAEAIVFLASSPDVASVSGSYFSEGEWVSSSPKSSDRAAAERLWSVSERLIRTPSAPAA
jgi:NAD(P)-dependent dehydrogenase (short-subunit alcohol dehydrogenase family)